MGLGDIVYRLFGSFNIPMLSAFSLCLLTATSPCPMATNIAAIAYVSRKATDRKYTIMTGVLYTLGRMVSYSVLGILIILAGLEIPGVATFLQDFGKCVLGPILIAVGAIMLNIDRLSFSWGGGKLTSLAKKVTGRGLIGGFLLGVLFALAFCPYSAILFFGMLVPLALKSNGGIILPAVFAIGTGLPVLIFGISLSFGVSRVSAWFNALTRAQKTIRIVTSLVLIGIGVYYLALWIQA